MVAVLFEKYIEWWIKMFRKFFESIKYKKTRKILSVIVVFVCGMMIWLLNRYTPMYGDDYNYL